MFRKALMFIAVLAVTAGVAHATPVAVDEILFDSSSGVSPGLLSGTVDMSLLGNVLTITLTNTSADTAGSGAAILLTGIGFTLPNGVSIGSGTANMGSSTAVGFAKPLSGDVSSEWGYDNSPLNSGSFLSDGKFTYNTVVSSMTSQTEAKFASGSIGQPLDLGGPDFGLVSGLENDGLGNGNEAIRSSIVVTLNLTGTVPSDLVTQIGLGKVGLSFGSPNNTNVPEAGTLSLLALGGCFVASRRRQRS